MNVNTSSDKWAYAFTVTLIILIVNAGIHAINFFQTQNQLSDIQEELISLKTALIDQEQQLRELQQQKAVVDYLNHTGLMPWPVIYNRTRHSVVLIQTDIGLGSGFVYSAQGYIVTNYHVVEDSTTIKVTFPDGNITTASKVGEDAYSDLALIKVDPEITALQPLALGNSTDLTVGEPVAAIGNPFGLSNTVTAGIVSALQRDIKAPGGFLIVDVVQVDAAINPGNSGGPLVNLRGQVVGINTAIISRQEETSFLGVGFAIPSDTMRRELPDLIATGEYRHPWLGVSGIDLSIEIANYLGLEDPHGFLITTVVPDSPAEESGLRGGTETVLIDGQEVQVGGDVITGVDDQRVRQLEDLVIYIERNKQPGDQVILNIIRDGEELPLNLTLGERPSIN